MLPLSTLHNSCFAAHFFQYTDRALYSSIFSTSFGQTNLHVNFYLIIEHQCVSLRPFYTEITVLTHHCSCWSSYLFPRLFPRLHLVNLPHPSFFQLETPFSCPYSFCSALSSHGGNLIFHFQAVYFHEQGQRSCDLFFLPQLPSVSSI